MMKTDVKKSNALKAFRKFGFEVVEEREHIKLQNGSTGEKVIGVPNHRKIKGSTLSEILNRSTIDKTAFFKLV